MKQKMRHWHGGHQTRTSTIESCTKAEQKILHQRQFDRKRKARKQQQQKQNRCTSAPQLHKLIRECIYLTQVHSCAYEKKKKKAKTFLFRFRDLLVLFECRMYGVRAFHLNKWLNLHLKRKTKAKRQKNVTKSLTKLNRRTKKTTLKKKKHEKQLRKTKFQRIEKLQLFLFIPFIFALGFCFWLHHR